MLDKLEAIKDRFQEVESLISAPDAMRDMKLYVQLNKEYKDLGPIVDAYYKYKNIVSNMKESKERGKEEKDEERELIQRDEPKRIRRREYAGGGLKKKKKRRKREK